ncbi:MAG: hypothetical protein GQ574_10885 [Crocinitomix sp.]|nr:hypothetical protein [Crocinitomix sp.]
MNTAELKNYLHKFIVETNDASVLKQAKEYLLSLTSKDADWYDDLNEQEKQSIERGLNDLKNGNTHTSEEVRKSIRQRIENKSA